MHQEDKTIENLLELDGVRFVIDDVLGLWVKFDVQRVVATSNRPHGIKYSLSLHDKSNQRIIGFDNAHAIDRINKKYDHWHSSANSLGKPYFYKNAAKLLEDFWHAVDRILKELQGA